MEGNGSNKKIQEAVKMRTVVNIYPKLTEEESKKIKKEIALRLYKALNTQDKA